MPDNLKINISDKVIGLIKKGEARMKPRWYFVLGSAVMAGGIAGLAMLSAFLVSLATFSLRTHGPMGAIRYEYLLSTFPWWAPLLAVLGVGAGVVMMRKYDFSYRKNFALVAIGFAAAVIFTGVFINYFELDRGLMNRGPMKRMYERYNGGYIMDGPGWRMMERYNAR